MKTHQEDGYCYCRVFIVFTFIMSKHFGFFYPVTAGCLCPHKVFPGASQISTFTSPFWSALGFSARERPPPSGMNETYTTWERLRWRVPKLKYGGANLRLIKVRGAITMTHACTGGVKGTRSANSDHRSERGANSGRCASYGWFTTTNRRRP